MEKSTGVESGITVKPSFGLEADEITTMLKDSMENAEQDIQARMLKEQQVEASRVIESVKAALTADSALLENDEINVINNAITALDKISQTGNADEIEAALDTLNNSTAIFAERRMDSSIKTALSGHSVDEV
ncbi:MAG: molecular chaperone HscA [Cognaticolwellia sp.]|jgi:molecular chaperone HscA